MLKMSPAQCRAARAFLGLTQSQLAHAAGLGLSTVVDFEKERRQVSEEVVAAMSTALQQCGVRFIDESGWQGIRVRNPGIR